MKTTRVYFRPFFNHIIPLPSCLLCHQPATTERQLCRGCESRLPYLLHHCRICAEPLNGATVPPQPTCGRCLKRPPAFNLTLAPLHYDYPIDRLIQRYKEQCDRHCLGLLSDLLLERLQQHYRPGSIDLPQRLIPVPLHPNRLRQRGFNQSRELAEQLSARLTIPVDDHSCRRHLDTPHQQGLNARQRRRNLRNAFTVDSAALQGCHHIALIDDVMTTGTTAQMLALTLLRAGIEQIDLWCLARTPLEHD